MWHRMQECGHKVEVQSVGHSVHMTLLHVYEL